MCRRDVLVTHRSAILRCVSTTIYIPLPPPSCEPRTDYWIFTIFTIYSSIPHLLPHIPCTYFYYHYRSLLVVLLTSFPTHALSRACTHGLLEVKYISWHFIWTVRKTIRKTSGGNITNSVIEDRFGMGESAASWTSFGFSQGWVKVPRLNLRKKVKD